MTPQASRPLPDRIEVAMPGLAALAAQALGHLPAPLRRRAPQAPFDRARDAFNRGDLEVVFALFDSDVEHGPPPPLHEGGPLRGRTAVFELWRAALARYEGSLLENLSLEEEAPGRFVPRARLRHSDPGGKDLDYTIVQTTEPRRGRVVRQVNVLDAGDPSGSP